jgi:hypothetical protein
LGEGVTIKRAMRRQMSILECRSVQGGRRKYSNTKSLSPHGAAHSARPKVSRTTPQAIRLSRECMHDPAQLRCE